MTAHPSAVETAATRGYEQVVSRAGCLAAATVLPRADMRGWRRVELRVYLQVVERAAMWAGSVVAWTAVGWAACLVVKLVRCGAFSTVSCLADASACLWA